MSAHLLTLALASTFFSSLTISTPADPPTSPTLLPGVNFSDLIMYTYPTNNCINGADPTLQRLRNYIIHDLEYDQNTPLKDQKSYQLSCELKDNERLDWSTFSEGTSDAGPGVPGGLAACSRWVHSTPNPGPVISEPTGPSVCGEFGSLAVDYFRLWRSGVDDPI